VGNTKFETHIATTRSAGHFHAPPRLFLPSRGPERTLPLFTNLLLTEDTLAASLGPWQFHHCLDSCKCHISRGLSHGRCRRFPPPREESSNWDNTKRGCSPALFKTSRQSLERWYINTADIRAASEAAGKKKKKAHERGNRRRGGYLWKPSAKSSALLFCRTQSLLMTSKKTCNITWFIWLLNFEVSRLMAGDVSSKTPRLASSYKNTWPRIMKRRFNTHPDKLINLGALDHRLAVDRASKIFLNRKCHCDFVTWILKDKHEMDMAM